MWSHAMTKPSCLSLAIPKAPTTADFAYPWLSSSAHLTPPYSPGKLPCASSPVRRCSEESTENVPAAVGGLLAIAPSANNNNNNNKTTKFPPAPACCQLHEASIDRPLDSEGSIIHEGCIGSHTVHRGEIIPDWAVGMTGRELEIRLQIAEIQKLYRDHQKELYQLSRTRRPSGKAAKKTSVDQGNAKPIRARGHSGSNRRHTAPESDGTGPLVVVEKSLSVPEITVIEAIEEEKENEKEKEEVKEKEEEKEKEKEKEKKQDEPHKDAKVEIEVESKPETTETVVANNPPESTANIVASVEMTYPFVETEIQPATTEKESFDSDKTPPVATLGLEEEQAEEEIVDSKPNAFERTAVEAAQPTPPRPTFPTTLTPEALVAGTRVIILEGGLFYSGTLSVADMDALIFQVQMDGQRSTRPYILCQEDLLLNALRELPLNENSSVHEGLRVCAVWSGQLQALYPGTVTGFAEETDKAGRRLVSIEFDDGDCGNIRLDDIRLLPPDFPITKMKAPVLPEFITRKRSGRERSSVGDRPSRVAGQPHEPPSKRRHKIEEESVKEPTIDTAGRKWQWTGKPQSDKRLRRTLYSAVECDSVQVKVGDLVHMLEPAGGQKKVHKDNDRYVAVVERFWETKSGAKKLRVAWCYRAHEIVPRIHVNALVAKRALFRSDHYDDNCIQSLSEKCELLSWAEFKKLDESDEHLGDRPNIYFLAGSYDPVNRRLQWADDCADISAANSKSH